MTRHVSDFRRSRIQCDVTGAHPMCFTSAADYKLWHEAARGATPGPSAHCADCMPEYKRRMQAAGRCSHEDVVFVMDDDGFHEGVRPGKLPNRRRVGRPTKAEVAARAGVEA
jgi:hypothetical protein